MKSVLTNPRGSWLGLYLAINILSAYIIYNGNVLLGESQELQLHDQNSVFAALLMVLCTYVGLLAVILPAFLKLKISRPQTFCLRSDRATGITLLILQVLFIVFFTVTGTFVAGSAERSENPLSAFWVIISVDSLFFIYYGFYRDSKLFWPNLIIAIVSNVLRGWTGIFSIVAFMESARLMRSGKMNMRLVLTAILLLTVFFPLIQFVKLQIRHMVSSGLAHDVSLLQLTSQAIFSIQMSDYLNIMANSGQQIIARLHLVSSTIAVQQNVDFFTHSIESSTITPFWKEGIYGIAYDRILGQHSLPYLSDSLAMVIEGKDEVHWNSNPGYLAWMVIDPASAPLYLVYTLGLLFTWVYMIKKLNGDTRAKDMIWFACLSYLVPGWIASCLLFTHSLLLFLLFHRFIGDRPSISRSSQRTNADLR